MATQDETPFLISKQSETLGQRLDNIEGLLRLLLLRGGNNLPITQVVANLEGTTIGADAGYRSIYENRYQRLLAAQIRADFNLAGQALNISLTQDLSNYSKIDELDQGGKITSDTIWLRPNQVLYVGSANTGVSLAGARFRVLLFDPLSFAGFLNDGI